MKKKQSSKSGDSGSMSLQQPRWGTVKGKKELGLRSGGKKGKDKSDPTYL